MWNDQKNFLYMYDAVTNQIETIISAPIVKNVNKYRSSPISNLIVIGKQPKISQYTPLIFNMHNLRNKSGKRLYFYIDN